MTISEIPYNVCFCSHEYTDNGGDLTSSNILEGVHSSDYSHLTNRHSCHDFDGRPSTDPLQRSKEDRRATGFPGSGLGGVNLFKGLAKSPLERQVDLLTHKPRSDFPPRAGARKPYLEVGLCLVRAVRSGPGRSYDGGALWWQVSG